MPVNPAGPAPSSQEEVVLSWEGLMGLLRLPLQVPGPSHWSPVTCGQEQLGRLTHALILSPRGQREASGAETGCPDWVEALQGSGFQTLECGGRT